MRHLHAVLSEVADRNAFEFGFINLFDHAAADATAEDPPAHAASTPPNDVTAAPHAASFRKSRLLHIAMSCSCTAISVSFPLSVTEFDFVAHIVKDSVLRIQDA